MTEPIKVNKTWTLFLDRDGVINEEKYLDYVYTWEEFIFYPGVKEAMKIFNRIFGPIVMVTNQRGVGKGLMTEEQLQSIHSTMRREIEESGGRLDSIYYCTSTDNAHPGRKPNPGMAMDALRDNPAIQFSRSIMVGNNLSDMEFGKRNGMFTVLINTTKPSVTLPHELVDFQFLTLLEFANWLQ